MLQKKLHWSKVLKPDMATCRSHVLPTTSTTQWPTRETASRPTPLKCHSSWASPPSSLLSSFVSSWALIPTTLGGGMFQIQHIFYIFKIQTFKHRHSHLPLEKQKKLSYTGEFHTPTYLNFIWKLWLKLKKWRGFLFCRLNDVTPKPVLRRFIYPRKLNRFVRRILTCLFLSVIYLGCKSKLISLQSNNISSIGFLLPYTNKH